MVKENRSVSFWVFEIFLLVSLFLLLLGQTTAIFNYDLAVSFGMQESVEDVGEFGVQINRAFGVGDTLIYIPLIISSIIGLFLKKNWALITTAAVMGVSAYWATTSGFLLWFLVGVPGYNFIPGMVYWLFIALYIIFGVLGLLYLILWGDKLLV